MGQNPWELGLPPNVTVAPFLCCVRQARRRACGIAYGAMQQWAYFLVTVQTSTSLIPVATVRISLSPSAAASVGSNISTVP
jgi:hypothetical protein